MFGILLQSKTCNKCGKLKPLSGFNADKRNRDGKRGICKTCEIESVRAWEERNPDKVSGRDWKAHYRRHADKKIEYSKQWNAKHPEKIYQDSLNRRARIEGNGGKITAAEWESLKVKYNYTCLCCKRREPEIELTLDHVKPLAMGGEHSIRNAQPLCKSCNSSKGKKWIDYR